MIRKLACMLLILRSCVLLLLCTADVVKAYEQVRHTEVPYSNSFVSCAWVDVKPGFLCVNMIQCKRHNHASQPNSRFVHV